jgi:hypothetical protein
VLTPSFLDHSEHSRHNLTFLKSFFLKQFNDWAVTVMFYTSVHMVEAILDKTNSIHSQSHKERTANATKKLVSFPAIAYKALERNAHDSRYKKYKVYDWEVYRLFKEHFQNLARWFNSQTEEAQAVDIQPCKNICEEWNKRYKEKDPECNKCH